MRKTDFRRTSSELPTKPGTYEARLFDFKFEVRWNGERWYTPDGKEILVFDWRER